MTAMAFFNFLPWRIQRDVKICHSADVRPPSDVFDVAVHHFFVRNRCHMTGEQPNSCGSQADILDEAIKIPDDDPLTAAIRLVQQNRHAGKKPL